MESLHQRLGHHALVRDLVKLAVEETLQCDPYEDKLQSANMLPIVDEEWEVAPEWGDQYVNEEILLPRGDRMARGQVVCLKQDANDNPIGRFNQNPILDTLLYEVEFPGGDIIGLAANVIWESIYTQCDFNGNKYLFLEASIDHGRNCSALNVEDQRIVVKVQETLRKSTAGWDICCK